MNCKWKYVNTVRRFFIEYQQLLMPAFDSVTCRCRNFLASSHYKIILTDRILTPNNSRSWPHCHASIREKNYRLVFHRHTSKISLRSCSFECDRRSCDAAETRHRRDHRHRRCIKSHRLRSAIRAWEVTKDIAVWLHSRCDSASEAWWREPDRQLDETHLRVLFFYSPFVRITLPSMNSIRLVSLSASISARSSFHSISR